MRVFGCLGCGAGSTENLQQLSQYHSGLHRTPSLTRHHRSGIPVLMAASSGLKSVDAGLMCVYVSILCFWPTRVLLWDAHSFSYFMIQLNLQATPVIWEHQHNIISYTLFFTLMVIYVCMYVCTYADMSVCMSEYFEYNPQYIEKILPVSGIMFLNFFIRDTIFIGQPCL